MFIRKRSRRDRRGSRSGRYVDISDTDRRVLRIKRQARVELQKLPIIRNKLRRIRRVGNFRSFDIRQRERAAATEKPANAVKLAKLHEIRGSKTSRAASAPGTARRNRLSGTDKSFETLKAFSARATVRAAAVEELRTESADSVFKHADRFRLHKQSSARLIAVD